MMHATCIGRALNGSMTRYDASDEGCDNDGVSAARTAGRLAPLTHVLACGGTIGEWRAESLHGWRRYLGVLSRAVEESGATWLTVVPFSSVGANADDVHLILSVVREAIGGTIVGTRLSAATSGGVIVIVDACADGRERLVAAANALAPSMSIEEPVLAASLYAPAPSDPDLVLVFGAPTRLPPSLVWELAYSEIVFLDSPWISCDVTHVHLAIDDFRRRERRFGGVDL